MEPQTLAATYAIIVPLLVGGMWIASLARHQVQELATKPWEFRTHIAAEAIMTFMLIGSGVATLASVAEGRPILTLAFGMTV